MTQAAPQPASTGWRDLIAPGQRGAVLLISGGVGMHAFNDLSIAATIPLAYADLDALPLLPLAYALFFIGVVSGGLISAQLQDRLGARATALTGATLFTLGVLMTATATTGWSFATGRALQGLSDGIIVALCYGLIPRMVRPELVARIFSVEAVVWAVASGLGPLAGGYATETLGWRAAMLVCLPLVALFLACTPVLGGLGGAAPGTRRPTGLPVLLALAGTAAFALPTALPGQPWMALAIPAGFGLFALALRQDARRAASYFPRRFFSLSPLGRGAWTNLLMPVAQAASSVFLALSLRAVWGLSPIWIGWIIITLSLSWSFTAMRLAGLTPGARARILRLGPFVQAAGLLLVATGVAGGSLVPVLLGQLLCGAAFGMVWGPVTEVIMTLAPQDDRARISSFLPVLQTTGFAIGAGLMGFNADLTGFVAAIGSGATAPIWLLWGAAAAIAALTGLIALGLRPDPDSPTG